MYVHFFVSSEFIGDKLEEMIAEISKNLSGTALSFYKREFQFFGEITNISGIIRYYLKINPFVNKPSDLVLI